MTAVQRRTFDGLIGTGDRPGFGPELRGGLIGRIEREVRDLNLDPAEPLWLGKETLNDHARCDGLFHAAILGEKPPFEHSSKSGAGALAHRAVELDVGCRDDVAPHDLSARAAERLQEDARFARFWRELDRIGQDELLMEVVRRVTMFRSSVPPLRQLRRELAPVSELRLRAELLGGALVLSGQVDLILGRPDVSRPTLATRLAIDLKTGRAYPEYPEDMRLYALLMTLRFGVPPYRVASLFLDSGEWQAEDVTERTLEHAAGRVIAAARAASELRSGRDAQLRPGVYCSWCPRRAGCPAAAATGT